VQQVKERPLQQEGCYFQKLREEWEEREKHWMRREKQ
jgi:hypothetical protein